MTTPIERDPMKKTGDALRAAPLEIEESLPLEWSGFINSRNTVASGPACDNMTISAHPSEVELTNAPSDTWQKGEYRNAFVLSQPITMPTGDRVLVIQGKPDWENIQGSCGIWAHATGVFDTQGVMVPDGFAGGASGFAWMGNLSSRILRGWTYQQAEGWSPNLRCFGRAPVYHHDLVEIRITRETTLFVVNGTIVKKAKTNIQTPAIVTQIWLDNYAIGLPFKIGYGKVTRHQIGRFHGISAFYGRSQSAR